MADELELPTLEETMDAQSDLAFLCRDRDLATKEIVPANAFYGGDFILKRYAGIPPDLSLRCVIPHGADLELSLLWLAEVQATVPAILCYSRPRRQVYETASRKVVIPSASPYVYATRLLDDVRGTPRRGTIFFLSHSTHHLIVDERAEKLAELLARSSERWQPITVCVYWKDFLLGRHRPFAEQGLRVVSAGHIYDPLFLFRLHHLCLQHEYSAGDKTGSHVFFSVHSGCKHVHLPTQGDPPRIGTAKDNKEHSLKVVHAPPPPGMPDLEATFLRDEADAALQARAAGYFLGYEWVLTPEELRDQLRGLERLDQRGYWKPNHGELVSYFPPAQIRRVIRRSVRPLVRNRWTDRLR